MVYQSQPGTVQHRPRLHVMIDKRHCITIGA